MTDEQLDKIEAFLKGKLSSEETAAFQTEIETDAELAKEVELVRIELQVGYVLMEEQLKAKMAQLKRPGSDRANPFWKRWLILLPMVLLLSIAIWYVFIYSPVPIEDSRCRPDAADDPVEVMDGRKVGFPIRGEDPCRSRNQYI